MQARPRELVRGWGVLVVWREREGAGGPWMGDGSDLTAVPRSVPGSLAQELLGDLEGIRFFLFCPAWTMASA